MTTTSWERSELIFALRTIGEVIENNEAAEPERNLIEIWEQIRDQCTMLWKKEVSKDE